MMDNIALSVGYFVIFFTLSFLLTFAILFICHSIGLFRDLRKKDEK